MEELRACKALCHDYKQIHPEKEQEREAKLRRILGKMGTLFYLQPIKWGFLFAKICKNIINELQVFPVAHYPFLFFS
ncbi:MAG: maltose acetyltransferase domain-containing protein, partial [Bacteroidales bacterium]